MTSSTARTRSPDVALSPAHAAIIPIAACAAVGDIGRLETALERGLDAGLEISETREILTQVYAYAGFPRSLNALGALMKVVDARKQRGLHDKPGREPSHAIPTGAALLAAGTANQTRLSGAPVKGPLFEFAPAIDEYLKTHLFGDIFERDNFDWQSRELATVSMLAALTGVEAQLQAHVRIAMNVGVSVDALREVVDLLAGVDRDASRRAGEALARHLASIRSAQ